MRDKQPMLNDVVGEDHKVLVEAVIDIRDEQVSLNKTLSAVLAGLKPQGTPDYTTDTR